jgi:hypothetical protein
MYLAQLKELANVNSGFLSVGIDYWVVYEFPENSDKLLIHSSGSNFGWEYETWEFSTKPKSEILTQLLDEKAPHAEKCKLILSFKRESIYSLGFSKPE